MNEQTQSNLDNAEQPTERSKYGTLVWHLVVAVVTVWWTFGLGNLAYAGYSYIRYRRSTSTNTGRTETSSPQPTPGPRRREHADSESQSQLGSDTGGGLSETIPGMRPGSGIRNLAVGVGYFFLVMMVLGALGGGADDTDTGADVETDASAAAEEEMHTVSITVVDEDGAAVDGASVEFVHDDAIIFDTRESKQTDSDGAVSFETDHESTVDITAEASGYDEAESTITITQDEDITLVLEEQAEAEDAQEAEGAEDGETDDADDADATDDAAGDETERDEADVGEQEASTDDADADSEDEAEEAGEAVATETDDADGADGELSEDSYYMAMEMTIGNNSDATVDSIQTNNDATWIQLTSPVETDEEVVEDIAVAGGAYAGALDSGLESDRVLISLTNPDGSIDVDTYADAHYAQQFVDSNHEDEAYLLELLGNMTHHQ